MTEQQDKFNESITSEIKTSCGTLFVTIVWTKDKKIKNIFSHLGKAGGCASSQLDALSYLAKLAIRADIPVAKVVKGLKGIACHVPCDTSQSCSDAFGQILEKYADVK